MTPLILGTHQNIVYILNHYLGTTPVALLVRYDVTTGSTRTILKLPNEEIEDATLSADGQWVIFVSQEPGKPSSTLQMVRMDGQEFQTLYCSQEYPTNVLLSPDQKFLLFSISGQQDPAHEFGTYLLDMTSGKLQTELLPSQEGGVYIPVKWRDNSSVYMTTAFTGAGDPASCVDLGLFLLQDITKDATHQQSNLQRILDTGAQCVDFDVTPDNTHLALSTHVVSRDSQQNGFVTGPSTIALQAITSGPAHTVYSSQQLALMNVRAISNKMLLFVVGGIGSATSQIGLWKMNTDGTELTRLTTEKPSDIIDIPISPVSRDGTLYAIEDENSANGNFVQSLLVGSLSGGKPMTLTSLPLDGDSGVQFIGWTTL